MIVDGQDEAEVDGVPEALGVLDEGVSDGPLVAAEGAVSRADSVQLSTLPVTQTKNTQRLSFCSVAPDVSCRSRSASAMACSHSSAPTVRSSASSSSSFTFTPPP